MILISGASGFIGGRLLRTLSAEDICCRTLGRSRIVHKRAVIADLSDAASLVSVCDDVRCVFHCAGYAHAFSSLSANDDATHWKINFEGTRNLLEVAARAGTKKFVYLSSVKAMAEPGEMCVVEDFPGSPETAYGESKRAAEQLVLSAGTQYGMHVVILRLAMVYGAGGHGNLERMARLVKRGLSPPLPDTGNHRSLVHVDDVIDVMRLVADDARTSGKTYIVASSEAPSGRGLFDALRKAIGMHQCCWSVPVSVLKAAALGGDVVETLTRNRMPFDSEMLTRLLRSAWYSPARLERELGWRAKISLSEGLRELGGK